MINISNIDNVEHVTEEYKKNKRVVISDIWSTHSIAKIEGEVRNTTFLNAYAINGRYIQSSDEELTNMSNIDKRNLQKTIYNDASNGIGFFYGRYNVNSNTESPFYKILFDYLNSEECLSSIRLITGNKHLVSASVQVTRYIAGNFLTRHNDILPSEGRAVAYVFGFTPKWHPDWGGLLHFFNPNGDVIDTVCPQNNVLTLFDVNLPHSVSYVTPFAAVPRYSITGWFNAI